MKKCPNCKRQIDDNSSFCEFCGCQIKHSKKPLWIALGAVAVAALLFVLLKPKNEPEPVDPDTQAYQACQTVNDYRVYICDYGRNALHYAEAQAFVDQYVADSLQRLLDSLAQARAREQAEVEKSKSVSGSANGHDYVDLGLPSGTLWATCNIGASLPEDCGNYYAWGETTTKGTYNWDTYKYANVDDDVKLTKYCSESVNSANGYTDNLIVMQGGDDPATVILGGGWITPSYDQWEELLDYTSNQLITKNGVNGRLFTAKNGQTLFLPAAGEVWDTSVIYFGQNGCYWSRFLSDDFNVYCLQFGDADFCNLLNCNLRRAGCSVRPVYQK